MIPSCLRLLAAVLLCTGEVSPTPLQEPACLFFNGRIVLNEVNTLPGMTSYSRYPRMMAAAGLPFAEVIDRIVSLTLTETRR